MSTRILPAAFLCTLLVPMACGDKDTTTDDSPTVEGDADADADTDTDTDSDTAVEASASLQGVITDSDGNPIQGARVSMCKQVCRTDATDATGAYSIASLEPWTHSFEVVVPDAAYSTPLVPLTMAADSDRTQNAVAMRLGASQATPQSPRDVEITSGVWVNFGLDNVELPFGADGSTTAGVRVPTEHWLPVEVSGTVLAMWYLTPFDAHPTSGNLPFRLHNDLGLNPGDQVQAWAADYNLAEWISAGTMTVSSDGATLENDGTGLPVIATLVLVQP